jgi:Ca2+-binding RTX toxin-like protein
VLSLPDLPTSLGPNRWLSTSTKGATLTGSDGARDQLAANTTGVTLVGKAMDDTYVAYDANTKIVEEAGGGIDTVLTYGHAYTLGVNVENLRLLGSANATATGNSGNNILTGNSGNNVITTGGGSDVLVGSGGTDTYVPTKQTGSVTWITEFKATGATIDKIDLRGFGLAGFDSIRSRMTQIGTDVQIDLGNSQKVMLEGKSVSALTAANFIVEAASSSPTDPPTTDPTPTDPVTVTPPPTDTGLPAGLNDLVMTFHDEFNTLNLYSTWKPTDGWGNRTLIGNKELELYVDPQ